MPTPFFADMVREMCQEGGTGPLTPTGAVPGHRRFAGAVPAGVSFHYAVAGIAQPGQWETGLGHIDTSGRLVRDSVAASSAGGAPVDFAPGLKTIALTVGAGWYAASDGARAALDDGMTALGAAVDGKQPLSTTHAEVATGAAGDLITVRRGAGWVNVPLATLPFQGAAGLHQFGGILSVPGGSAAAPAISFTGDLDTGVFRPGSNTLALAVGGAERMRITSDGRVGIGRSDPPVPLSVLGAASSPALNAAGGGAELKFDSTAALALGGGPAPMGYALWLQGKQDNGGYTGSAFPIALNPLGGHVGIGTGAGAAPAARLHVKSSGEILRLDTAAARGSGSNSLTFSDPTGRKAYVGYGSADDRFEIVNEMTGAAYLSTGGPSWQFWVAGTLSCAITASDVRPGSDNSKSLGNGAGRWSVVYSASGAINTSDAREKRWRGSMTGAELAAARRIVAELGFYQWNDAIAAKGEDSARYHFGVRAQAVWDIMAGEGLCDRSSAAPCDQPYAFLCHDAWAEEGGSRFGIRPDQLTLFLIAAQEARIAMLEGGA
ncbi:hypothetical protein SAMN05428974_2192 [Sphingopyxis sp. YR583]|uniref:tail fiber domain-containing protein n=1 Tax=Sphingopyxis sp. YR583 TaxID=1881047 RepID=UPI0008A76317|nr:tail fiber domain-containing protein [Sphingopyxis sp. YR583]SEH17391.1 hypothetical protein SAMN05428974_2192 [Sphingopyxis sp. YR583]